MQFPESIGSFTKWRYTRLAGFTYEFLETVDLAVNGDKIKIYVRFTKLKES